MPTFDEVLAMAAPPETVVPLIVGGDKLAEIRELERKLADAPAPASLAERSPASLYGEQIAALQEQLRGTEVGFRLRAMPGKAWNRLKLTQPEARKDESKEDFAERWFAWLCLLVSATCVDPVMTPAQVEQLAARIPGSSWDSLADTAWALNAGTVSVPFSQAASTWIRSSEATSRRPPESESPSAGSAAKSAPRPRRTSTTRKAD